MRFWIGFLVLLLLLAPLCHAQEERGGADEDNIGRTEADDDNAETGANTQLGRLGPIQIPFRMPLDGTVSLGLYSRGGQLVRILGQVLALKKGEYTVRWDGLDLFGNPVPAPAELELKLIANKPLQAFYEFSVSAPKVAPWGGSFDGKTGGWLADHSAPNSLTAVGNKILIGAFLAEHGNNLIAVNLAGEKLWGVNLAGWIGPAALANDGQSAYALMRARDSIVRVDPEQKEKADRKPVYGSGKDTVQAFAALAGKLYLVKRDHRYGQSPFEVALHNGQIDFAKSRPQILNNDAPTEFTIGAQTAWGNTFTTPGNPQNGAGMIVKDSEAFALVVFKEPVTIGTLVMGKVGGANKALVYTLKSALAYDETYSPLSSGADDAIDGLNLLEFSKEWELFGESDNSAPVSLLPAKQDDYKTQALLIRCLPAAGKAGDWRPRLQMARIMKERFSAVATKPGWKQQAELPVSGLYPADVEVGFDQAQALDGVLLLNCVNPEVAVEVPASGSDWTEVGRLRARFEKRLGHLSASKSSHEQFVHFTERLTTKTLRFRHLSGYRQGKWGPGKDDSRRVETDAVVPVRLLSERPRQPSHQFEVFDLAARKPVSTWSGPEFDLPALAFAPDGTLFSIASNRLCRTELTATGLKHTPLGSVRFSKPWCLAANAQQLAVGDWDRHAVFLFNHSGQLLATIGDKGPRARGPWNPDVVERPNAVAFAADGTLWVAEELFSPKRVARYTADGKFIEEFLGPPMYGGGGYLDPSLKSFYYRSMEFALDWDKGTSRLLNLNDRLRSEQSPVNYNNSFTYTGIGEPIIYQGRRYIVGENSISLLENGTWRPCVVMGDADNAHFLLGKPAWNRHWAKLDLAGQLFIWCDLNGDGNFQVEEVELFPASNKPGLLNGLTVAPDLSLWGNAWRAKPSQISAAGVPVFKSADFTPFSYDAAHYSRNYTLGGPRSAKSHYFGFKYVSTSGALYQEGQPFVVLADGAIKGGTPATQPSDYLPLIDGLVPQQTFQVCGGAPTKSAVGEIVVVNSNQGYWYVWAVDYGVCIGTFFTGETGGWGWGQPAQRGLDVTGRKQEWEGWGGHFLKADNGRYYATAGKGFHGISRIEGLDEFQVLTLPVKITADQARAAAQLRPVLKARFDAAEIANAKATRQELPAAALATRTKNFKLDGELDDWGPRHKLVPIGDPKQRCVFDISHDERGLYIALGGQGNLESAAKTWKELFRAGFAFDLQWRTKGSRSRESIAGDRRLVIAKLNGQWTAVLYDYDPAEPKPESGLVYESTAALTRIGKVSQLPADAWKLAMKEDTLELSAATLDDALDGVGEAPTMPGGSAKDKPATEPAGPTWSGELFLPWTTLGLAPGATCRFDAGLLRPGQAPVYWSNRYPAPAGDPALEAMLNPAAWGTLSFGK